MESSHGSKVQPLSPSPSVPSIPQSLLSNKVPNTRLLLFHKVLRSCREEGHESLWRQAGLQGRIHVAQGNQDLDDLSHFFLVNHLQAFLTESTSPCHAPHHPTSPNWTTSSLPSSPPHPSGHSFLTLDLFFFFAQSLSLLPTPASKLTPSSSTRTYSITVSCLVGPEVSEPSIAPPLSWKI